jgi:ribosomal protein S3
VISYNPNYLIGESNCEVKTDDKNVIIIWKQNNVYIKVNSFITEYDDAVFLAESIAKSGLVKK